MRQYSRDPTTPRFKTLQVNTCFLVCTFKGYFFENDLVIESISKQNNYWAMVTNVFPVWQEELKEYSRRHSYPTPQRSASPKLSSSQLLGSFLSVIIRTSESVGQ